MPILEMNTLGEIVENNGENGFRRAESVQDDNMLKLSIVEDQNVLRDREALKKIEKAKAEMAKQKWMQNVALKVQQAKHQAALADRKNLFEKKLKFLQEIKKNTRLAQALAQSGSNTFYEKMSGVTGYGLTKDGHVPQFSSEAVDFAPIVDVDSTFGSFGYFGASEIPDLIKPAPSVLTSTEKTSYDALSKKDNVLRESGQPDFPFNYADEMNKTLSNPNYLNGVIDMNEYLAAKKRGWGTTGFYYNEGRDNLWWGLKVAFHPHMIFFKRVPSYEGKAATPRLMMAMRGYIMQFGKMYDRIMPLGRISEFAYEDVPVVAPAVQAVTPRPQPVVVAAPIAPVAPVVPKIVEQEKQIVKAIENIEKQVEAQIKTEEKVAEITKPVASKTVTDYRHPMLVYGLLAKKEVVAKDDKPSKTFTVFGVK